MLFSIVHTTRYSFTQPVFLEPHVIRLVPKSDASQTVLNVDLTIDPIPAGQTPCVDLDGNHTIRMWFDGLHESLTVTSTATVRTLRNNPFDYVLIREDAENLPQHYPDGLAAILHPFLIRRTPSVTITDWARSIAERCDRKATAFLTSLNGEIYESCETIHRDEGAPQEPLDTWKKKRGACRDMAYLFMDACRSVGLPARFVSGYQAGERDTKKRHLHAWAEVYFPEAGWRGYDPTHGLAVGNDHVIVATGPTAQETIPIEGNFRGTGAKSTMEYKITLEIHE